MPDKKTKLDVEITAATQDEAVAKAQEEAVKQGYKSASIKNIISITYKATLYNPIIEEKKVEEKPQE